jgi:hypothetical protein
MAYSLLISGLTIRTKEETDARKKEETDVHMDTLHDQRIR